jgi:hypothetical protein
MASVIPANRVYENWRLCELDTQKSSTSPQSIYVARDHIEEGIAVCLTIEVSITHRRSRL